MLGRKRKGKRTRKRYGEDVMREHNQAYSGIGRSKSSKRNPLGHESDVGDRVIEIQGKTWVKQSDGAWYLFDNDDDAELLEEVHRQTEAMADLDIAHYSTPLYGGKVNQSPLGVTKADGTFSKTKSLSDYSFSGWSYCDHWQDKFELAEGISVLCSSYMDKPIKAAVVNPDLGIYFDDRWAEGHVLGSQQWNGPNDVSTYEMAFLGWADFGVPADINLLIDVLEYALNEAANGRVVEIGCHGGHGRTGTALAAMLILLGEDATSARKRVWADYCVQAIETKGQEQFLDRLEAIVRKS